eukprot:6480485-Amphidinium_carterae.1
MKLALRGLFLLQETMAVKAHGLVDDGSDFDVADSVCDAKEFAALAGTCWFPLVRQERDTGQHAQTWHGYAGATASWLSLADYCFFGSAGWRSQVNRTAEDVR